MKMTITIEEGKESEVQIERPGGGAAAISAEEHPTDTAATSAGGPPEWLLSELGEGQQAHEAEAGEKLDAGPAPATTNGMGSMRA
jgi:hypothetical protein